MKSEHATEFIVVLAMLCMLLGGCAARPEPQTSVAIDCKWERELPTTSNQVEILDAKRHAIQRQTLGVHELFDEARDMAYRIEYTLEGTLTGWHEGHVVRNESQWAVENFDLRLTATSLILNQDRNIWEEGRPIELSLDQVSNLGNGCIIEFDAILIHPGPIDGDPIALRPLPVEVFLFGDGRLSAHGFPLPSDEQPGLPFVYRSKDAPIPDFQLTISRGMGDQGNETWELKEDGWHRVDDAP